MRTEKSFESAEGNTFDVYNKNNQLIAYYYEHFFDPETNERLENPVFEIYYDFEDCDDSTTSTESYITENKDEIINLLVDLEIESL
jgi:hypothetical protein